MLNPPQWAGRFNRFVSLSILLSVVPACSARPVTPVAPVQRPVAQDSKVVRIGEFVGDVNEILRVLPLEVVIPARYERATLPGMPNDYSYWMPPERVAAVVASGDLPVDTGFFHSKLSLNVGYDAESDVFVGFEDRDRDTTAAEMKQAGMEGFESERIVLRGGYPALLVRFQNAATKRVHYSAYVATLYESIVFYISYTPADGDSSGGAETWARFGVALARGAQ